MTVEDLHALLPKLEAFYTRFHRFFRRPESRRMGGKYLMGLTLPIERKNGENIAEQVAATPRKLQEFLSDSPWDDAGCVGELQAFVGEQFGAPNGVLVLDDTGFAKKGTHSAGVGRQYSGTLGRTDNCQVGVFMGYASAHGHTLVDRRLYVLRPWFEDPVRRATPKAALPAELRERMREHWGDPPGELYVDDSAGEPGRAGGAQDDKHIVLAALTYGNVALMIQPPRGFGENPVAIYHDPDLPP